MSDTGKQPEGTRAKPVPSSQPTSELTAVARWLPPAATALTVVVVFLVAQLLLPEAKAPLFLLIKVACGLLVGIVVLYLTRSYTRSTAGESRTALGNALLWTGVIAAVVVTVEVNYISARHHMRSDWTSSHYYSLSEKSEAVLSELARPVKAVVFLSPRSELYAELFEDIRVLMADLRAVSPSFTVEYVDPDRDIEKAELLIKKFDLPEDADVVVLASGEKVKYVGGDELAEWDYGAGGFGGAGAPKKLRAFKGEEAIVAAIMEVSSDEITKLCFTKGHRETPSEEFARDSMSELVKIVVRTEALETSEVDLPTELIADDCSVLIIAGPQTSFTTKEAAKIDAYLKKGGRLLALFDPYLGDPEFGARAKMGLEDLLTRWGVKLENALVFDPEDHIDLMGAGGAELLALRVVEYSTHPIVKPFEDGAPTIFRLSRPVLAVEPPPEGIDTNQLLFTSEAGWGERDLTSDNIDRGPDDVPGPVPLGVAVDAPTLGGARIVVFGNARFIDNTMFVGGVNYNLFVNSIRWLTKKEKLITIPSKAPELVSLDLGEDEMSLVFWVAIVLLPLFTIGVGTTVWWVRRAG